MDFRLGAPEYAALLTIFTGGLVGVNWKWIRRIPPSVRFGDLAEKATDALLSLQLNFHGPREGVRTNSPRSHVLTMIEKLDKLDVPHPAADDLVEWLRWLPQLIAWVKTKNLKVARRCQANPPS